MSPSCRSTSAELFLLAGALVLRTAPAAGQACCAGAGAVTPARLGLHDDAVVGLQARAADVFGSFDARGEFVPAPAGAREWNFEQDVYSAIRVLQRGQLGLLVPFVETYRESRGRSELGGGLGDLNVSARYDFVLAHESVVVPGIALLFGVTLPTGRAVEDAEKSMATDATGLGAVQVNGGLALEQAFGPWLVGASGWLAYRAPRDVGGFRMSLAPQLSLLASTGYAFDNGASLALSALYSVEGDAEVDGVTVPDSSRRSTQVSTGLAWPASDQLFVLGSVFLSPPIDSFGVNQPATAGVSVGAKWASL